MEVQILATTFEIFWRHDEKQGFGNINFPMRHETPSMRHF